MLTRNIFCLTIPSIITGLFYGPLTDRIGRKPIMIVNITSFFIYSLLMIVIEVLNSNIYYVHIGAAIFGFGGYIGVLTSAIVSYLSDTVDTKSLAFRIGKLLR